jgi:predicted DCC family thiol-disulfide oxidoreductase YuxK
VVKKTMATERPTLIYDGDCGFCRRWVEVWRLWTGERIAYLPSQSRGSEFPQITDEMVKDSVVFVDPSGQTAVGAEAVFRSLAVDRAKSWLLWCYRRVPGFAPLTEWFYRHVAQRRMLFSRWTRWVLGKDVSHHQYFISRRVFLFFLGIIYCVAFLSFGSQIQGLIGSEGILPAARFLSFISGRAEHPHWAVPTLFWLNSSDAWLSGVCWLGAALGMALCAGYGGPAVTALLWLLYLSLFSVGQVFLGYQWDILLLETGFLAIFLTPLSWIPARAMQTRPSTLVLWMFRWLTFRLMFESGMVKYLSGDPAWRDGSAMGYHYWSQPLPVPLSYWAAQLPAWFQRESTFVMFVIELGVPFLVFFPNPIRMLAAMVLIGFQILILSTGNYGFFNLLTIALCFLLIADHYWPGWLKRRLLPQGYGDPKVARRYWPGFLLLPIMAVVFFQSVTNMRHRLDEDWEEPAWMQKVSSHLGPLHLANAYGLFAVMTKSRPEITVEGSQNGEDWRPYLFKYKPNSLQEIPPFLPGHMPRLDWQMWFAGLRPPMRYGVWFDQFLIRLLEGSKPVLALLKENPFPEGPPKRIRARVANYYFNKVSERRETGNYWWVGPSQPYSPVYVKEGEKILKMSPSNL